VAGLTGFASCGPTLLLELLALKHGLMIAWDWGYSLQTSPLQFRFYGYFAFGS